MPKTSNPKESDTVANAHAFRSLSTQQFYIVLMGSNPGAQTESIRRDKSDDVRATADDFMGSLVNFLALVTRSMPLCIQQSPSSLLPCPKGSLGTCLDGMRPNVDHGLVVE